uniref:Autophagy protein ATG17-like domain-containing protein n=1 Tax=Aplanochytrium stocchinoi TaxID=215587 RepID=A0A7S3PFM8_9STRA|eukprot:CAMPEP_0204829914 /NCGR_PEP_ID=MMETSP1346-20131115/8220_1 /ASSEMBLY_ACC=CAM_ASM_000771 /TAXON_ID=215587 /ORGANISM="Aplanochytrium stocchinoi, Strain GSBS06" /LENGTH=691 /DNA_ID=CAMNT_0051960007 /DNA_START=260 /DNA_END=2335 /DNA_ORIENTATION=+
MVECFGLTVFYAEFGKQYNVTVAAKSKDKGKDASIPEANRSCLVQDLCREIVIAVNKEENDAVVDGNNRKIKLKVDNMIMLYSTPVATTDTSTKHKDRKFRHIGLGSRSRLRPLRTLGFASSEPGESLIKSTSAASSLVQEVFENVPSSCNLIYLFNKETIIKRVSTTTNTDGDLAENAVLDVQLKDEYSNLEDTVSEAKSIVTCTRRRVSQISLLLRKSWIRKNASKAVWRNLLDHYSDFQNQYQNFVSECKNLHSKTSEIIDELEACTKNIADIPLPSSLKQHFVRKRMIKRMDRSDSFSSRGSKGSGKDNGEVVSLLDCLNIDTGTWISECRNLDATLTKKKAISDVKFEEIENAIASGAKEEAFLDEIQIGEWKKELTTLESWLKEQSEILEQIKNSKSHNINHLMKELILIDKQVVTAVPLAIQKEETSVKILFEKLKFVSKVQSEMQLVKNRISMWHEGSNSIKTIHGYISQMRLLPITFAASMAEIVRRRSFGLIYSSEISLLAERIGNLRAEEVKRREDFVRKHGKNLPSGLIPGIHETHVPHCEIDKKPFDSDLPEIDLDEVHEIYVKLGELTRRTVSSESDIAVHNQAELSGFNDVTNPPIVLDPDFEQDKDRMILRLKAEVEAFQARLLVAENISTSNTAPVTFPSAGKAYLELEQLLQKEKGKTKAYEARIAELEKLIE